MGGVDASVEKRWWWRDWGRTTMEKPSREVTLSAVIARVAGDEAPGKAWLQISWVVGYRVIES